MKRAAAAISVLLMPILACAEPVDMSRFRHIKELTPPAELGRNRKIGSFELDDELLNGTVDGCANLRIVDSDGAEAPFLVRDKTESKAVVHRRRLPAAVLSLKPLPDNRIELVLERKEPRQQPSAVVLETGQRNYEKTVGIYGSDNRDDWHTVILNAPIFDYSRYVDLQNNSIDIAGPAYRYYRFELGNIAESHQSPLVRFISETRGGAVAKEIEHTAFERRDFRIDSISFIEETREVVKGKTMTRQYRIHDLRAEQNEKDQFTVVTFSTVRAPIRAFLVHADTPNFSRTVTVEARDGDDGAADWKKIASSRISRIDLPGLRREDMEIGFGAPQRYTQYRLRIHNLDNPPVNVTAVDAKGDVREILFFATPGERYRAVYGASAMEKPSYDIASIVRDAVLDDTDVYSPGPQVQNPDFDASAPGPPICGRTMLVVAVLAMVLALTWLIARSVKGIESL